MLVEACVDSVASAMAAERGGAGRVELCDALFDGGTTPSAGMIAAVKARVAIPVFVIIRPRGGGFVYSEDEVDVMLRDIAEAKRLGVDGIVVGPMTEQADPHVVQTRKLIDAAGNLPVTFHRAFDLARNQTAALETLVSLGVRRVLTSGGAPTALAGVDMLHELVRQAANRVTILAGGGIDERNVHDVVERGGVAEVHVRGTRPANTGMLMSRSLRLRKALPSDEDAWEETDERRVRSIVSLATATRH
jgi:copper homeostasis protein